MRSLQAKKNEYIAYSVLRTGACARFRYSKDRAGEKVLALDADGNRIVDIVDSRTDLDFYKRNYQFRLKAHLVPHNEETAQPVTLNQQAALNQTKGKMAQLIVLQLPNWHGALNRLVRRIAPRHHQRTRSQADFRQRQGTGSIT